MNDGGLIGASWNGWSLQELLERVRAQAERARQRDLDLQSWFFEREAIERERVRPVDEEGPAGGQEGIGGAPL